MLTIIILAMVAAVLFHTVRVIFRVTAGIAGLILLIAFLPLLVVGVVLTGMFYLALPFLLIMGIIGIVPGIMALFRHDDNVIDM